MRALAGLVTLAEARIPGKQTTREISILKTVASERTGEDREAQRRRTTPHDAAVNAAGGGQSNENATRRRREETYDEKERRQRRTKVQKYMDRGDPRGLGREGRKRSLEVGIVTMDRITDGRYEWRDSGD